MPESFKTILLVEDEVLIAMAEGMSLQGAGYKVISASSGEKAVEAAKDLLGQIDLILMDIDLGAGIDGTDAAREILSFCDIPIIFLSSHTEKEIVDKTEEISSYGYVVKNSGETVLFASIKMAFKLHDAYRKIYSHKMELEATLEELQATNEEFEAVNAELEESQSELIDREERLKKSLSFLQATLESTLDGILAVDCKGKITSYNKQFLDLWEVPENIISAGGGEALLEFVMSKMDEPLQFAAIASGGKDFPEIKKQDVVECADGRTFEWYMQPQYVDGVSVGMVWSFRDITPRLRSEEKLRESYQKLDDIIEFLPDPTFVIDRDKKVIAWNRALFEMTGIAKSEVLGKSDYVYSIPFYGERRPILIDYFDEPSIARNYSNLKIENGCVHAEMSTHMVYTGISGDFDLVAGPLLDSHGRRYGAIEVVRDVTEKKALEEQYRIFAENSLDIISIHDRQGILTYASPACRDIVGYEPDELVGQDTSLYIHPDDRARVKEIHHAAALEKEVAFLDYRFRCKDGSYVWFDTYFKPLLGSDGEIQRFIIVNRDVTEKKISQDLLLRERMFTDSVFNSVPGLLYLYDSDEHLVRWNRRHEELTGYSPDELKNFPLMKWFEGSPEDYSRIADAVAKAVKQGYASEEAYLTTKAGKKIPFNFTIVPLEIDGERYFTGAGTDVSERRQHEKDLLESEKNYREIFENNSDAIFILDVAADGRFIIYDMNPAEEELVGLTASAVSGKYLDEIMPSDMVEVISAKYRSCVESREVLKYEEEIPFRGWKYWFQTILFPVKGRSGNVERIIGFSRNITDTKNAQKALVASEMRLRNHIVETPVGIIEWDSNACVTGWNPAAEKIFGYSAGEVAGRNILFLVPEDMKDAVSALTTDVIDVQKGSYSVNENITKDGRTIVCEWHNTAVKSDDGVFIGGASMVMDITERVRSDEELVKSAKEKEILMRELQHRVKNNLALIVSFMTLETSKITDAFSRKIFVEAQNRIRAFAGLYDQLYRTSDAVKTNIAPYLRKISENIVGTYSSGECEINLVCEISDVSVDIRRTGVVGVIVNELITNSIKYAFLGRPSGEIKVHLSLSQNRVCLEVSDNGVGITRAGETQMEGGSGLKLVKLLVQQLEGDFMISHDNGTRCVILFDLN